MNIVEIRSKEMSQLTSLRIGDLRRSAGISLAALSRKTGFAESYLSNIENCKREPSLRTVIRIASAFGVDVMFLISGVGSKNHESEIDHEKSSKRSPTRMVKTSTDR